MVVFFITSLLIYSGFIGFLIYGFFRIKYFRSEKSIPKTGFTVIVPFRNEAGRIKSLLLSFSELKYDESLYEIIFVDDDSTDNTVEIIENYTNLTRNFKIIKNLRKSNSPKKDAIETAIKQSQFDWIVTTDADCFVDENWLQVLDDFIQVKNPKMVAGGVSMVAGDSFIDQFQQLDYMSLQGTTMGGFGLQNPIMCSGANLAYAKNLFTATNGFQNHNNIVSGDDVFMLENIVRLYPGEVYFLKHDNFIVLTQTEKTWKNIFHQRIRWASKSTAYQNLFSKTLGLAVLLGNLALIAGIVGWLSDKLNFWVFYLGFGSKIFLDAVLLIITGKYLKPGKIKYFLVSLILYPFYFLLIALCSLFSKYEWKGRKFSR